MMLTDLEEIAGKHVQQQVERGFAGHCIHFILEDAGKPPVFRGVGIHLDLAGNTVGDVTDEFK